VSVDRDVLGPRACDPPSGTGPVPPELLEQLLDVLRDELPRRLGASKFPVGLDGQFSSYSGASPLAVLFANLLDGSRLPIVWKDLSPMSAIGGPTKPEFVHDARRELAAYAGVLDTSSLGTARCYGVCDDPSRGRHWLFLERVPGVRLPESADPEAWPVTARWLADFHRVAGRRLGSGRVPPHALRYDAGHLRRWIRRALARCAGGPAEADMVRIADRYERVVDRLTALPVTLIHGELYPNNVLVVERAGRVQRVCPLDWETFGVGPGLLDLAALTSGTWDESRRSAVVAAYLNHGAPVPVPPEELCAHLSALDYCRLHLCVQWIASGADRPVPADQAHGWRTEAVVLADHLFGEVAEGARR
jgi:Ser/Thr protein kinase RdoA (MazF antagonist)